MKSKYLHPENTVMEIIEKYKQEKSGSREKRHCRSTTSSEKKHLKVKQQISFIKFFQSKTQ